MKKDYNDDLLHIAHLGENPNEYYNSVVPPVFLNSLHLYDTELEYENGNYIYGRHSNPLVEIVENKLAALEKGKEAIVFASGMAATTTAIMHACKAGSHVICQQSCYNPVKDFFKNVCQKLQISVSYISCTDLSEVEATVRPETSLIIIESPGTFVFDIIDIEGIVRIAKKHGIKTYIDNTYCTPLFQKPLDYGVDYVMHTASKYLGGHSDIIGGALIVKEGADEIKNSYRQLFGSIIGPMEAWLMLRGMRTLPARVAEHQRSALDCANYLQKHPKVKTVYHPGLPSHPNYSLGQKQMSGTTGLFSLELDASLEMAMKFVDGLKLFGKGCSWGGFESLAIMPLRTSDEEYLNYFHASRGLIRLHCGLEGSENLMADLEQALAMI